MIMNISAVTISQCCSICRVHIILLLAVEVMVWQIYHMIVFVLIGTILDSIVQLIDMSFT